MKKAALIGNPVSHSLSPVLHNFWCKKNRVIACYEAIELKSGALDDFLERIRRNEFVGANVTTPYKEAMFKKMDRLAECAAKTGAVNTIVRTGDGKLEGRNSDPEGFICNLDQCAPDIDYTNITAMVLGTGGAARACIFALLERGANVIIAGRSPDHLQGILDFFSSPRLSGIPWAEIKAFTEGASLLVNATSLGMQGNEPLGFDFEKTADETIVYDLVYRGEETTFLKSANLAGLKTINGLGMLIFQAIPSFEAWFGKRPAYSREIYDMLAAKAG